MVAAVSLLAACNSGSDVQSKLKKDGYTQVKTAIYSKVIQANPNGRVPQRGDIISGEMQVRYMSPDIDTIIGDNNGHPTVLLVADSSRNSIDPTGCIFGTHEGEKVIFAIPADSVSAVIGSEQMPSFYKAGNGGAFYYEFNIMNVETEAEFGERYRLQDSAALKNFIQQNNITEKPSSTGLYRIVRTAGNGTVKVAKGKTVSVHYTGRLLSGEVFDSSEGREPISIEAGAGQVIEGWEEGLMGLTAGTKATLIIPYQIGYGESGRGPIPPFSTMVFDVEVVDVK